MAGKYEAGTSGTVEREEVTIPTNPAATERDKLTRSVASASDRRQMRHREAMSDLFDNLTINKGEKSRLLDGGK